MKLTLNQALDNTFAGAILKGLSCGFDGDPAYMGTTRQEAIGKRILAAHWTDGSTGHFKEPGIVLTVRGLDETGTSEDILAYEHEEIDIEN